MAIACVFIPSFPLVVAWQERTANDTASPPASLAQAAIVVDKPQRGRVIALSPAAYALGVRAGMSSVQAAAAAPEAEALVHDPAAALLRWEEALDRLDASSPAIESPRPGVAYLDLRGIPATLEEQRTKMARAISAPPCALPARVGIASTRIAAYAAARVDRIIEPRYEAAFLAAQPLRLLGLPAEDHERLALFGVRRLGELSALPAGALARRFGTQALRWHALARGEDRQPLRPRPRRIAIEASAQAEEATDRLEAILFACRGLIDRLAADLQRAGRRCARMELTLGHERGGEQRLRCEVASPTARAEVLFALLRARLEGMPGIGAAVNSVRAEAVRVEGGGTPLPLLAEPSPDPETLQTALARVAGAFGEQRLQRAELHEAFRPEARFAYVPFELSAALAPANRRDGARPTAHLRLLESPREVPVRLRRGVPCAVDGDDIVEVAGPWRTAECWWRQGSERDDYDVQTGGGAILRIARAGARWYVLGSYA
ncbi:MAG: DNA polymerase Y family protein [bacterium]|nr:DNA polymerase Y family protein [bacterium]